MMYEKWEKVLETDFIKDDLNPTWSVMEQSSITNQNRMLGSLKIREAQFYWRDSNFKKGN
ncbi:hypothetical protein pb186bvf_001873 [Paramecium bursaria]